jgi:hypothetical protein
MQDKSRLDPELVEDFVNNAQGNLDRVRDLLDRHKTIVDAAWDWGGGDWETGLGQRIPSYGNAWAPTRRMGRAQRQPSRQVF